MTRFSFLNRDRVPIFPGDKRVLVLGGGVAGLATAVALTQRGFQPIILESRHFLGGRTYSFKDQETGEQLDNGQHVLLTCYKHTWEFLRAIGALDLLQVQPALSLLYREKGGQDRRLSFGRWPGLALLRLMWGMARHSSPEELDQISVEEWLNRNHQPEALRRTLYHPVAIAALNQHPQKASAALFVEVMRRSFSFRRIARMAIPTVGLSDLLVNGARRTIQSKGGSIHLDQRISKICWDGRRITGVQTVDGKLWTANQYISALPPHVLAQVLPPETLRLPGLSGISKLTYSGIISIYLWLDKEITQETFVGLLDTKTEWLFNRPKILTTEGDKVKAIGLVLSAANDLLDTPKEQLVELAKKDLESCFPESAPITIQRSVVIKEKKATISHEPGQLSYRPMSVTPIDNLLLAGDWVNTGLPATIEGAVQSAHACVDALARRVATGNTGHNPI